MGRLDNIELVEVPITMNPNDLMEEDQTVTKENEAQSAEARLQISDEEALAEIYRLEKEKEQKEKDLVHKELLTEVYLAEKGGQRLLKT